MTKEHEYVNLYWNCHGSKKSVVELYPEIETIPEFNYGGIYKKDKLLRYINYLYSESTPLIKKFKDNLLARKTEALKLAEIKLTKDVENDLFDFKDREFARMVVKLLAIQKNHLWSSIQVNEQAYSDNMNIIVSPTIMDSDKDVAATAKIKGELLKINGDIADRLNGYYKEFFKGDEALRQAAKSVEFRAVTPETVAQINRDF